jgi:hypothetical protein
MSTPVIFRAYPDGDIVALFPTLPADQYGYFCMSYATVGQHSAASPTLVIDDTDECFDSEREDLKIELEGRGYDDLVEYKTYEPWMLEARVAEAKQVEERARNGR